MKILKKTSKVIVSTVKSFIAHNGSLMAAAIAYYLLISVIPLIILIIAIAGFFLNSNDTVVMEILKFTYAFNPMAGEAVEKFIYKLAESSGVTSQIGFLGLIWIGSKIFQTLEEAVNAAWEAPVRKFYRRWLVSFIVAISLGTIPILSVLLTVGSQFVTKFGYYLAISESGLKNLSITLNYIIPLTLSILMFTFIFKILPNRKARWSSCLIGGVTTGLLFEAAKHLFGLYLQHFASYDKLYGSIGGLIGLVVWANYAGIITVFGAEMSAQYERETNPGHKQSPLKERV